VRASHVVVGVILVFAALAAAGCSGPKHMSRNHGKAFRAHFERQVANPAALEEAEKGLDSEEAAIVAGAYRRSLAPKNARDEDQSEVLLLAAPPRGGERQAPLAPSVPKE
jgi:hypothetical protein